ncbi:MAG: hypothetical protein AB1656_11070 [Candidatus Omnitrophota bacterium]
MNTKSYAIFRKDFHLLAVMMLGALGMQAAILIFVPVMNSLTHLPHGMGLYSDFAVYNWFPKVQVIVGILFALVAAAFWSCEERAGQHDWFLRRLPVSRRRVWGEKTAAGLSVVGLALIINVLWFYVFLLLGVRIWSTEDHIFAYLLVYMTIAYFIGLPLSRILSQSIGVILSGMAIMCVVMIIGGGSQWIDDIIKNPYASYQYASHYFSQFLSILTIVLGIGWLIAIRYRKINQNIPPRRFWFLVRKQAKETILFSVLILAYLALFVMASIAFWQDKQPEFLPIAFFIGLLLSAGLGVNLYSAKEKEGTGCVLYHHPISRSEIYWVKYLYGLALASVIAILITAAYYLSFLSGNSSIHLPDTYRFENAGGKWGFISYIINYGPARWRLIPYFFLFGLIPYHCGILTVHAVRNSIYAFFETILAIAGVLFVCSYLQFFKIIAALFAFQRTSDFSYHLLSSISFFPWILFLMLAALALAGCMAANDRHLLTSGTFKRHIAIARLYFAALAIVVILVKTGWKDLFYLLTNIDIGIG